jgi:hypothetical protein
MSDDAPTLPTTQIILEEMRAGFASVNKRLSVIEHQLEQMDIRLDRIESVAHGAHSEVMNLRADFKEFRAQFKEPVT